MKMKKNLAMLMIAVLLLSSLSLPAMADTNPTIETGKATYSAGKLYFSNLTLSGEGIRTILISFSDNVTTGDRIDLPPTPGGYTIISTNSYYYKRIVVDATISTSALQDYLRGVAFTVVSPSQTVSIIVTTENMNVETYYNSDTQHYYQYVPDTSSYWTTAYNSAKGMSFMGRAGYLATITSKAEDTFLNEISGGKTGWLGGTILSNSGTKVNSSGIPSEDGQYYSSLDTTSVRDGWYWACGPEIGNVFYTVNTLLEAGYGANSSGAAAADADNSTTYYNWARGTLSYEPNNRTNISGLSSTDSAFETCLTTLRITNNTGKQGTTFSWNDKLYTTAGTGSWDAKGYFVEYGNESIGDSGSGSSTFATDSAELSRGPTLTAGAVLRTTDTAGTVKFSSDRAGAYYYAVVADGATEPAIDTNGTGTSCIAGENVITNPVGLTAGAKDIYIKVKDSGGNVSDVLMIKIYMNHETSPVTITPYSGTFDGSAHSAVAVSGALSGDVVTYSTNGTDFSSMCPTGTNIGDYPVYVKVERNGYNPWISEKKTAVINTKAITSDMVSMILSAEYSGQPLTPLPEVTYGSITLVKDSDYTVGYSHNTDIGLATVTITGKANYSETVTKDFAIFEKTTGVVSGAGQGLQVTADGLDDLYNDEEIYTKEDSRIEEFGGQVSIDLFVLIKTDLTDDKTMIENLALDKIIGLYFDISLFKTVTLFGESGEDVTKIHHTNDLLTVTLPIPDSIKGKAGIALYRVHNGIAAMIPIGKENAIDGEYCTIDAQNITLYVRNFSTYGIGYDKALIVTGDNETNPDTRDYTTTVPFMVLGICSLFIAILYGKKRKTA